MSTYFLCNSRFYDQTAGVITGSLPAPAVANFYLEHFEQQVLWTAPQKPTHWYRYVNGNFMLWPHSKEELGRFHIRLNSIHQNIMFSMQTEENSKLLVLNVLARRKLDGSLGHTVWLHTLFSQWSCWDSQEHALWHKYNVQARYWSHQPLMSDTETVSGTGDTDMADCTRRLHCIVCGISWVTEQLLVVQGLCFLE
jgi:hypothetical protein